MIICLLSNVSQPGAVLSPGDRAEENRPCQAVWELTLCGGADIRGGLSAE